MRANYSVFLDKSCIENDILPNDPDDYYNFLEEIRDELPFIGRDPWDFPTSPEFEDYIRRYEFQHLSLGEGWHAAYRIYEEDENCLVFAVAHGKANLFHKVVTRFHETDQID